MSLRSVQSCVAVSRPGVPRRMRAYLRRRPLQLEALVIGAVRRNRVEHRYHVTDIGKCARDASVAPTPPRQQRVAGDGGEHHDETRRAVPRGLLLLGLVAAHAHQHQQVHGEHQPQADAQHIGPAPQHGRQLPVRRECREDDAEEQRAGVDDSLVRRAEHNLQQTLQAFVARRVRKKKSGCSCASSSRTNAETNDPQIDR